MRKILHLLFGCTVMLAAAVPCTAVQYEMIDLGTLGGDSRAYGVSNGGHIAGLSSQGGVKAFLWDESTGMRNLGTLSGPYSEGYGVNAQGRVVGYSTTTSAQEHAFIWDETNGMRDLGTLSGGYSEAHAINDFGQVVGESDGSAFMWSETSGLRALGLSAGIGGARGYAISNSGMAAGSGGGTTFSNHAVTWDPEGNISDIGTLLQDHYSYARGINDLGQVVGWSGRGLAPPQYASDQAFIWSSASGMRGLGTLPGSLMSYAYDINNHGQAVGYAFGAVPSTAFIWDEAGGMRALENLPGTTNSYAYAINDAGWIVGYSEEEGGNTHAVLWKPVPEPSGLLALGSGLLALCLPCLRRRHRRCSG